MNTGHGRFIRCAVGLAFACLFTGLSLRAEEPMPVTVLELIGGITKQVGVDTVAASGFFKLTAAGPALFKDKEQSENPATKDVVMLSPAVPHVPTDYKPFEGKRVTAVGKFMPAEPEKAVGAKAFVTFDRLTVDPTYVSLIQLIVTPEKFDGLTVVTAGFYPSPHHGSLLFFSKENAENGIVENSIPFQYATAIENKDDTPFSGKFVRITGKFIAYKPDTVVVDKGYILCDDIQLTRQP